MSESRRRRSTFDFPSEASEEDAGLTRVADQYRNEGYRVMVRPKEAEVPSFLRGHSVNLLAFKGDEKVIVLVKANRKALQGDSTSVAIAKLVEQHPDWRLDLMVLGIGAEEDKLAPDAKEPLLAELERSLASAEDLSRSGENRLCCMAAWAALEAAMRQTARSSGLEVKSLAGEYLVRLLYSNGLLDRRQFDRLDEALKIRNAVVHGLVVPEISASVPKYVIGVARSLLHKNGEKPAA